MCVPEPQHVGRRVLGMDREAVALARGHMAPHPEWPEQLLRPGTRGDDGVSGFHHARACRELDPCPALPHRPDRGIRHETRASRPHDSTRLIHQPRRIRPPVAPMDEPEPRCVPEARLELEEPLPSHDRLGCRTEPAPRDREQRRPRRLRLLAARVQHQEPLVLQAADDSRLDELVHEPGCLMVQQVELLPGPSEPAVARAREEAREVPRHARQCTGAKKKLPPYGDVSERTPSRTTAHDGSGSLRAGQTQPPLTRAAPPPAPPASRRVTAYPRSSR